MKNILIVCIQGLTSSIWAKKLTKCASDRQDPYQFKATSVENVEYYAEWADFILLTPQVKNAAPEIEKQINGKECQIKIIADTMIAVNYVESSYANIKRMISGNDKKNVKEIIRLLFSDIMTVCLFIAGLGLFFELLFMATGFSVCHEVYEKTVGIACLYIAGYIGKKVAQYTNHSPYVLGAIGVITILMFGNYLGNVQGIEGIVFADCFSLRWFWIWSPVITVLLLVFYKLIDYIYTRYKNGTCVITEFLCFPNIMSMLIYMGFICGLNVVLKSLKIMEFFAHFLT